MLGRGDFFDGVPHFSRRSFIDPKTKKPLLDGVPEPGQYNPKFITDADKKNEQLCRRLGKTMNK